MNYLLSSRVTLFILLIHVGVYSQKQTSASNKVIEVPSHYYPPLDSFNIKPLKVGERVPDILFDQVINYPSGSIRLSEFKGKLLLLDFWSTWCAVCIAQFPKMEYLQAKYGGKLQIVTVGFDAKKEGDISKYISTRRGTKKEMKLPTIVQSAKDTILQKLFPFRGLPYVVWINENGILIGLTDHLAVSQTNIENVLNGRELIPHTINATKNFVKTDELFLKQNNGQSINFGSVISKYLKGMTNSWPFGLQYDSSFYRFYDINRTVFDYYQLAYEYQLPELRFDGSKRIIVESKGKPFYKDWDALNDPDLDNIQWDNFMNGNTFCYEAIYPRTYTLNQVRSFVISDLDRFFSVESRVEKRRINCLELIAFRDIDSIKSKLEANSSVFDDSNIDSPVLHLRGETFESVINTIKPLITENMLIFDGINHNSRIDISIPFEKLSIGEWNKRLRIYGLKLEIVEKDVRMLVLYKRQ